MGRKIHCLKKKKSIHSAIYWAPTVLSTILGAEDTAFKPLYLKAEFVSRPPRWSGLCPPGFLPITCGVAGGGVWTVLVNFHLYHTKLPPMWQAHLLTINQVLQSLQTRGHPVLKTFLTFKDGSVHVSSFIWDGWIESQCLRWRREKEAFIIEYLLSINLSGTLQKLSDSILLITF